MPWTTRPGANSVAWVMAERGSRFFGGAQHALRVLTMAMHRDGNAGEKVSATWINRRQATAVLLASAAVPFTPAGAQDAAAPASPAASPAASAAEAPLAAIWPADDWAESTPEAQGMDSAALAKLVDFGAAQGMDSLLVTRHGSLVAEAFYAPYREGLKHAVNST